MEEKKPDLSDSLQTQADAWIDIFNSGGDKNTFISAAESLLQTAAAAVSKCDIPGVDMIFVMDESGSIGPNSFEQMRQLAINITDHFEIGPNDTQVGWINFDHTVTVIFNLSTYQDKMSLHDAIRAVPYSAGGTNIAAGLLALLTDGFTMSAGARNSFAIPEVAIVVTDGESGLRPIQQAATLIRESRNINVFVVGIGSGVNRDQLNAAAAAGIAIDVSHVYLLSGFIEHELNILQETIRARACFDALFSEHETTIEEINQGDPQSTPQGATSFFNVDCPPEGLTINACGREGKIILYVSKTVSRPNSAVYDRIITVEKGECRNTFVNCSRTDVSEEGRRRRRQAELGEKIFMTIEGVEEENEYELDASVGDFSTPQVNLLCRTTVANNRQSVEVSCFHDRELTDVQCIVNSLPVPCSLPFSVVFTPPTREYSIQINVTDSLNLTDSATITHTVGPLAMDCSLNKEAEITCSSTNQLDQNKTVCSFRGTTYDPCILPQEVDVKGLPLGTYKIQVTATDVFGSTVEATIDYQVVGDRVGDDMVFSVVLDISPAEVGVREQTVSLCYQVHGEENNFYNLVSDDCVSVNAHVTQPIPEVNSHVIDKIGVRAIGTNNSCYDILIARESCAVSVNGDPIAINTLFEEEGVRIFNDRRIFREPNVIHISVPNCGRALVDMMNVTCTEYGIRGSEEKSEVLEFTATRGISSIEAAQGLVGQFWGRFMLGQSQTPLSPPRQRYDKAIMIFHDTILKRLDGFVSRSWSHHEKCFYAGDRQGNPVILGNYTLYEVEDIFSSDYRYSRFQDHMCE